MGISRLCGTSWASAVSYDRSPGEDVKVGSQIDSAPLGTSDPELLAAVYPRLRRFAAVAADLDMEPDDLVQEALCQALARGSLSDLDNPFSYLCRTTLNLVSNQRRSRARERNASARRLELDGSLERYPSDLSILYSLSATDRVIVFLADVELVPLQEIAESIGLSYVSVRHRASRSRKSLRTLLEKEQ